MPTNDQIELVPSLYVGIDVGINGAVAAIGLQGVRADVMPVREIKERKGTRNEIDLVGVERLIRQACTAEFDCLAALQRLGNSTDSRLAAGDDPLLRCVKAVLIERQRPMPKQGVTSMFHLGESYGLLRGLTAGMHLRVVLVEPKAWKADVLKDTAKDKDAAIEHVRSRWQVDLDVGKRKVIYHDGMADAVCIAEYGERNKL